MIQQQAAKNITQKLQTYYNELFFEGVDRSSRTVRYFRKQLRDIWRVLRLSVHWYPR